MNAVCASPISWEVLVGYWANDLDPAQTERIDEHLMRCDVCTAASARVAAIQDAVRVRIAPFLVRAEVEALRGRGLRIVENPVVASERITAVFGRGVHVLLHRLGGLDLQHAENAHVTISHEETGQVLMDEPHVPFDRDSGEILIACQRHFGAFSRTIVFEVRVQAPSGAEQAVRYAIPHVFEDPG